MKFKNLLRQFNQFSNNNWKEHTRFYNEIIVLILSGVVKNSRNVCIQKYKLVPFLYFFTTSELSYDVTLK